MNIGLPGTGLGGLFYVLLGLSMPLYELWRTAHRRSSAARWMVAAVQSSTAAAILVALWAEAWLIERGIVLATGVPWLRGSTALSIGRAHALPDQAHLVAVASILALVTVLVTVHIAGTVVTWRAARAV